MLQNWVANAGANRPPWILGAVLGDAGRGYFTGIIFFPESVQLTYYSMGKLKH